jgi:hypothetical protein
MIAESETLFQKKPIKEERIPIDRNLFAKRHASSSNKPGRQAFKPIQHSGTASQHHGIITITFPTHHPISGPNNKSRKYKQKIKKEMSIPPPSQARSCLSSERERRVDTGSRGEKQRRESFFNLPTLRSKTQSP